MEAVPAFEPQIKNEGGRKLIFDPVRKKFVTLTPEENVRQQLVHHLIHHCGYPSSMLSIEKGLTINQMKKRTDIVAYSAEGQPFLLVECKAPGVQITEKTFRQAAIYNFKLQVPYLLVSNGATTLCAEIDWVKKSFKMIGEIPRLENRKTT